MRIFKNKAFNKWSAKEGISDEALRMAVVEIERGLIDADLGGYVIKKRVAIDGRGKSSGVRTLLAYRVGDKVFFLYGFAKNARANVSNEELKALKNLAKELLKYSDPMLTTLINKKVLIEVIIDE